MSQEELDELEWLRAWDDDLTEEQFNRLKQLEVMAEKNGYGEFFLHFLELIR